MISGGPQGVKMRSIATSRTRWRVSTLIVAVTISSAPVLALVTAGMLLADRHLSPWQARVALLVVGITFTTTVGSHVAREITERLGTLRPLAGAVGVALATAAFAVHPSRLLQDGNSTAERLTWLLQLEDNARFVGVAREMVSGSPSGGPLAEMFGTGFVAPALLLLGATAPDRLAGDPRTAAIDVVNLSAVLAILMTGLLVLLGLWSAGSDRAPRPKGLRAPLDAVAGAALAAAAITVTVVIPMQVGFLSFVWGVVWLGLAALIGGTFLNAARTSRPMATLVSAAWCASAILMIGSWPFLIAGLVPMALGILPAPNRLTRLMRRRPVVSALSVVVMVALTAMVIWSSPIRTVLTAYGIDALTVAGSLIITPPAMRTIAILATLGVMLVPLFPSTVSPSLRHVLRSPGMASVSVGLSVLALWLAAAVLTGGQLGYAGPKLLHGFTAIAFVVALPAVAGAALDVRSPALVGIGVVTTTIIASGVIEERVDDWADFARADEQPHSRAMQVALMGTSPDVPIRCLPAPGRSVTDGARWATYFCVNWAEDAFNEGRFHGYRSAILNVQDDTFEPLVERILEERVTEYSFAYRLVAGAGWAGWNGQS